MTTIEGVSCCGDGYITVRVNRGGVIKFLRYSPLETVNENIIIGDVRRKFGEHPELRERVQKMDENLRGKEV